MARMNRKFTGKSLKYESFLGDIDKEINKVARQRRIIAANHVKKKLRDKTTEKFGAQSSITKGVGSKHMKTTSLVGVGPPAQAAHLIEFGTDKRFHKTGKYQGKSTGRVKADPFVEPVYKEEAEKVRQILSKEWF